MKEYTNDYLLDRLSLLEKRLDLVEKMQTVDTNKLIEKNESGLGENSCFSRTLEFIVKKDCEISFSVNGTISAQATLFAKLNNVALGSCQISTGDFSFSSKENAQAGEAVFSVEIIAENSTNLSRLNLSVCGAVGETEQSDRLAVANFSDCSIVAVSNKSHCSLYRYQAQLLLLWKTDCLCATLSKCQNNVMFAWIDADKKLYFKFIDYYGNSIGESVLVASGVSKVVGSKSLNNFLLYAIIGQNVYRIKVGLARNFTLEKLAFKAKEISALAEIDDCFIFTDFCNNSKFVVE